MKRSTDRFLTTHTGSLPRPEDLIRMMYAKEEGVPVDPAALARHVAAAVDEVVREAGDGWRRHHQRWRDEQAELRHVHQGSLERLRRCRQHVCLSGSGGLFPVAKRVFGDPGLRAKEHRMQRRDRRARSAGGTGRRRPSESGASTVDATGGIHDGGVARRGIRFRNDTIPTEEAYLFAIAEAMRQEYETIARSGMILQIDCPDLGMDGASSTPT